MQSKTCTCCGVDKPLDAFSVVCRRTGLRPARGGCGVAAQCKWCCAEKRKPGIHAERERSIREAHELFVTGLKKCTACGAAKELCDFSARLASKDGLSYKCRECYKEYVTKWRFDNPSAFKEWAKRNEEKRRGDIRKWSEKNKASRVVYMNDWAKSNAHLVRSNQARRNARKLHATPSWANQESIKAIYAKAVELTALTGVPHEVDHIYPLQGRLVCGLHCEKNLQVLTQFENIQKLNRTLEEWNALREKSVGT